MSDIHPHDLHQLMRTWLLAEDPYGMNQRREPVMGMPPSDDRARVEGLKGVEDALRPGQIEPDATGASTRAFGAEAVDQAMDKAMTQQWIDRMRASKAGKKAVSGEMDKAATEGWKQKMLAGKEAKGASPDPRAGPAGEDAVRNAMLNMNMKPLIDHTLEYQRMQALRDMIQSHIAANPPPELPESEVPQNMNRLPGTETSFVTTNDFSQMPEFSPGVRGVMNAPPLVPPTMPPAANRPPKGRLKDPEAPDDRPPE